MYPFRSRAHGTVESQEQMVKLSSTPDIRASLQ